MPNRWVAGEEWLKRGLHHHSIVANILWLVHWLALELVSPLTLSHLNTGLHLTGSQQHGFIAARPSLPISRPRPRCFRYVSTARDGAGRVTSGVLHRPPTQCGLDSNSNDYNVRR